MCYTIHMKNNVILAVLSLTVWAGAACAFAPAEWADTRIGTDRSHGSNIVGPSVPHGSAHPSPDSVWPATHVRPNGAKHGFGPPTSGWWPGDPVVGFSQLHSQGTGGTPSYGIFRYVFPASAMELVETHPYRLRVRLTDLKAEVEVSATAHGAIYRARRFDGKPLAFDLNRRCKLAKPDCVNKKGEFTGNWNPAPFNCYAYSKVDAATGLHRIAISFKSEEQAKVYFDQELAGRDVEAVAREAKALWNAALGRVVVEGLDAAERRKFYSHLMQTFVQPRNRVADGIGWDDHYTMWDTWKTLFPLMGILDPAAYASNVNSFGDRFARTGRCEACYTSGKEFKTGQGGDEVDYVIADAFAKKIPGIDWARIRPLLESRWTGRTRGYREKGYTPIGERENYCGRMKSGSATIGFAYQDWCCAEVLGSEKFRARSGNWTNVWDAAACDRASGVTGFVRARRANGAFANTDPRRGFNSDFYEATCWEASFFVPHMMDELIVRCGGKAAFEKRLSYALEHKLIDFGNEPSFQTPWLFAYVGRGDLVTKWAHEVAKLFAGEDLPGDNDSGAMSAYYIFLKFGFYPIAGQDLYVLHGSAYPKIEIKLADGKTFTIRAENLGSKAKKVKAVTLNGKPHDPLFLRHGEIVAGGELVFIYE